ncbi:response regulator [Aquabacterium sp. A7-Y]|uniref:response regulator n=1 Tax=Aquabacterium sp. A7-Y TaxID=1349605 RepID=UPI00223CF18A|nr:response regulator [Aquabacterium sp. A7-Y]MCW7540046.1 response regulator [Aquabacterium sp. A7-Y]
MKVPYRVAVQGFSAFERATFEAFFRLAARRSPAYEYVAELPASDYVIADADTPEVHRSVRDAGRWAATLFVGEQPVGGGLAQLPRPLNLINLLRVLDDAVSRDTARHAEPAASLAAGVDTARSGFPSSTGFSNSVLLENDDKYEHILVVDDSDLQLRFMQSRLKRFGFKVHLARSGEEALQRLAERQFDFVFLDVMMQGMDGYQTCRVIKRRPPEPERPTPVVVLLSSRAGTIDRIRGTLAGCDAYLAKPLSEDELVRVIGKHHPVFQRAFDSTLGISTTRPAPEH